MELIPRSSKRTVLVVFAIAAVAITAYAFQDRGFWNDAAQIGMAEVALGNLALQKAQNEKVKAFADQMVKDHTASNTELMSIASSKNVTLPAGMSPKHQATHDKLNRLSGAEFDREYMKVMVKDHETAVKLFEKQSRSDSDADAKAFAAKHLPALQGHLQMARTLSGETKQASKNGKSKDQGSGHASNSDHR